MNKITAALLALALLASLAGCGGDSAENDVPSDNIESTQAPPEALETTPAETAAPAQGQDPAQSGEPSEAVQDPAQSEGPAESETPAAQPTKQPVQPAPSSAPAATPAPTSPPATSAAPSTPAPTPAHTHSYTTAVTKEPTCAAEGVKTYACSCGDSYTEAISKTNEHSWATRHIDEVGHMESNGTHIVRIEWCDCGVHFRLGDPDDEARRREHYDPFGDNWWHFSTVETREEPNDPQYVIDTPAHDETYCTICGTVK